MQLWQTWLDHHVFHCRPPQRVLTQLCIVSLHERGKRVNPTLTLSGCAGMCMIPRRSVRLVHELKTSRGIVSVIHAVAVSMLLLRTGRTPAVSIFNEICTTFRTDKMNKGTCQRFVLRPDMVILVYECLWSTDLAARMTPLAGQNTQAESVWPRR